MKNNKDFLIVVAILAITVIITFPLFATKYETQTNIKMSEFPKTIDDWTGEDVPFSQHAYKPLETGNLIIRNYKNQNGETINLYIIYSQANQKIIHPPEISFLGAGETIIKKSTLLINDDINANRLVIENDIVPVLMVYWYKVGKLNTNSYIVQQLKTVTDRMLLRKTSLALVRISTKLEENDQGEGLIRIKKFCALIVPLLDKYVP